MDPTLTCVKVVCEWPSRAGQQNWPAQFAHATRHSQGLVFRVKPSKRESSEEFVL
jgi:hypothetical protein